MDAVGCNSLADRRNIGWSKWFELSHECPHLLEQKRKRMNSIIHGMFDFLIVWLKFLFNPFFWIHKIYAPWTLVLFVLLGIVQGAVAIDSGVLTIHSLPRERYARRRRNFHRRLFIICAVLLPISTIGIGFEAEDACGVSAA
jgi:hypothetical protein